MFGCLGFRVVPTADFPTQRGAAVDRGLLHERASRAVKERETESEREGEGGGDGTTHTHTHRETERTKITKIT